MNTNKNIRVRFAPSPTGNLHIGGARTALFNYLFARRYGGAFVLRIEDTDRERSTEEFTKSIMEGMHWLGMEWDEGPFHQFERLKFYQEQVQKLMDEGKAYRCYCTAEELEAKRKAALKSGKKPKYDGTCRSSQRSAVSGQPFCIRFKAPEEGTTKFTDICRDEMQFDNKELDDLVIARSDGTPTYNLTVVVDDVLMKMTHIIRGDDHLNNTPRQILLYQAFNYPVPQFAHLPMILGPDKQKLSKRHGAVSVIEYQKMGFLPEAMLNYLARLGWSHGDQEIFTKKELMEKFDLSVVGKSPSVFDIQKCTWVNSQHLLKKTDVELVELSLPYFADMGITIKDKEYTARALHSEREKAKTLKELSEITAFYLRDEVVYDPAAVSQWLNDEGKSKLKKLKENIETLKTFDETSLKTIFEQTMQEMGIFKMVELAQPVRVALCGSTKSPGIYEVMLILGKERVLHRLGRW